MSPLRHHRFGLLAAGTALTLATAGAVAAVAAPSGPAGGGYNPRTDATGAPSGTDTSSAIVQLSRAPLATSPKTAPGKGKKLAFGSTAVKNERAQLAAQRNGLRQWLKDNAPQAKITGEYDVALNAVAVQLNGTPLSTVAGAPNVVSAGYEQTYTPSAADPDLALIDGKLGWAAASPSAPSNAGHGVKVAIVDTGIDVSHPCFADKNPANDGAFTNDKVIVAKVFSNRAGQRGYTPAAVQDHGTHVAGTVACNAETPASVGGAAIPYAPSGVAPGALLGNYNVFPGDEGNGRSEDILNALQAAAEDGMDVINMSLGGDAHGAQDLLTHAVDNLDRANIVVAVAAGNEGPGHFTLGSPGSAERALTAGASSVGHFVGIPVYAGTAASGTPLAVTAVGDFPTPSTPLTGNLVPSGGSTLTTGCTDGSYSSSVNGNLALVLRGTCTFSNKVSVAEKAGAKGVIVVNNVPGDPTAMATDAAFPSTIVAVMASQAEQGALMARSGMPVTIGVDATYATTGNDDIMANFSSQGPTDVTYGVKPDVVAPGVNILSSLPASFCSPLPPEGCWGFMQGTSMATPHLAGTAAVVRQAHPTWSAAEVRSAIVNTAKEGVLTKSKAITTLETDPQVTGSGLEDVDAAVGATLALSSVSTSFGSTPSGAGKALTRSLTVTNLTGSARTVTVTVSGDPAFTASASSLNLPANGSTTLTVTFAPAKNAAKGDRSATLRFGSAAHSVLYGFLK